MQFQNDALSLPLQQTKTKGFVYTVYIYIFLLLIFHTSDSPLVLAIQLTNQAMQQSSLQWPGFLWIAGQCQPELTLQ